MVKVNEIPFCNIVLSNMKLQNESERIIINKKYFAYCNKTHEVATTNKSKQHCTDGKRKKSLKSI
jgi:hypothetical protein